MWQDVHYMITVGSIQNVARPSHPDN